MSVMKLIISHEFCSFKLMDIDYDYSHKSVAVILLGDAVLATDEHQLSQIIYPNYRENCDGSYFSSLALKLKQ